MLNRLKVCAVCSHLNCDHDFGTYKASAVYSGWLDFLRSQIRLWASTATKKDQ